MAAARSHVDVSVIVRSTARPTLGVALASLAVQDGVDLEVVVVAASGVTHPHPAEYCGPHALRFVPSEFPLRRPAAANAGLDAASGDAITFLDDDDCVDACHIAGLCCALRDAPGCGVVHSYADAVFADGRHERFGHPFSLAELYERNYIHLSTALIRRESIAAGCRFDEALDIHQDWDLFLQLAQLTCFTFVPVATFHWNADAGTSGAGGGRNQDDARFAAFRDKVYAKWAVPRNALIDRVIALLSAAAVRGREGDLAGAESLGREALLVSPNDPHALNLIALVARRSGRLDEARATQELAVSVRPHDPALAYNLALIAVDQHDVDFARACCRRALSASSGYPPATQLLERLAH